jgi:membrane protein YdbS with pleckstrin-like domain
VVTDDIDELTEDTGPKESALAWLRFAGELLIAAAVGVGIYFAFTVLWQMVPKVAVVVAPLAVTGLVAGVSLWRQRFGHAHVGLRLLAVLVFAGTLLTVLPAAGLITGH